MKQEKLGSTSSLNARENVKMRDIEQGNQRSMSRAIQRIRPGDKSAKLFYIISTIGVGILIVYFTIDLANQNSPGSVNSTSGSISRHYNSSNAEIYAYVQGNNLTSAGNDYGLDETSNSTSDDTTPIQDSGTIITRTPNNSEGTTVLYKSSDSKLDGIPSDSVTATSSTSDTTTFHYQQNETANDAFENISDTSVIQSSTSTERTLTLNVQKGDNEDVIQSSQIPLPANSTERIFTPEHRNENIHNKLAGIPTTTSSNTDNNSSSHNQLNKGTESELDDISSTTIWSNNTEGMSTFSQKNEGTDTGVNEVASTPVTSTARNTDVTSSYSR